MRKKRKKTGNSQSGQRGVGAGEQEPIDIDARFFGKCTARWVRDDAMYAGSKISMQEVGGMDGMLMGKAAGKMAFASITTGIEILMAMADVKSTDSQKVLKSANIPDRTRRPGRGQLER